MSTPREGDRRFIRYLQDFVKKDDRAPLAALRRGLGKEPAEASDMYPYVVRWLPPGAAPWEENAYYLIAALFALHQGSWPEGDGASRETNLGASLRRLAGRSESAGVEPRFVALLNSHVDDLPEHLRRVVALLKAYEVPVDWAQLLRDVQEWNLPRRRVQRAWARAYWGGTMAEAGDAEPAAKMAATEPQSA
jgi:CRISPR system Cascade subunit CasB